jgi:hypothetical protein
MKNNPTQIKFTFCNQITAMNLLMVHITESYKDTLPARQSDRHSPNIRRWRLAKLSQFALKFMNILITASLLETSENRVSV